MQFTELKRFQKRQLRKIYRKMDDGSELCDDGCYRCCIGDIKLSYVEFAFLIDGLPEQEVVDIFSKPRKMREDGKHFLCPFLDDSNSCSRYEQRPWVCRAYKKELKSLKCTLRPLEEKNNKAAQKILQLNKRLDIPDLFKDYADSSVKEMTIRDFFNVFIGDNVT